MTSVVRETESHTAAPLRAVRLGKFDPVLEQRGGGIIHIRAAQELGRYDDKLSQPLEHSAKVAPDRIFLAQRAMQGHWRKLTYAEGLSDVNRTGGPLLGRGLSPDHPIGILSGHDSAHAFRARQGRAVRS